MIVAQELQRQGYFVLPSYDYSGDDGNKSPRLQGDVAQYVVPDLDVSRNGKRMWVEVKTKSRPSIGRRSGKPEHGIDGRHLSHYLKVQEITGCPVYVVVYETATGQVLRQSADEIAARGRRSRLGEYAMVYFIRDEMKCLFTIPAQRGMGPADG